ncbi:MAG: ATP-binding cassette domain-containing protein [Flavobacteriia bacterium]|nr:ATP-binding cassette domain-containing protein [Flavobacteriia bacterium]
MILETEKLTKKYGKLTAVNELDLSIPQGTVFGLLGPNGSGKTTTLGMVLGAIRPSAGQFKWFGTGNSPHLRRRIGAILEHPVFYPHLSGEQNLKISAEIKRKGKSDIHQVLEFVGLHERKKDPFKAYSLGMKQRLAIASALVADPDVLILDEPTNGLDPEGIHDMRDLIVRIAQTGKTIVLASHLLDEVQKVCSDYAVLKKGKCIHKGNVESDLLGDGGWRIKSNDLDLLQKTAQEMSIFKSVSKDGNVLIVKPENSIPGSDLNNAFMDKGIVLSELSPSQNTLEQKFLELLKTNQ